MSRSLYLIAFLTAALFVFGTAADSFAQSSYTGSREGFVGSTKKKPAPALEDMDENQFNDEMKRQTPQLPPVFDNVQAPKSVNEAGYAEETVNDPCAAYLNNYDGYTICQDRMNKIQKLKDGQKTRQESYGTRQTIRASEQRRLDAEKAAAEAAEAAKAEEEKAKAQEEKPAEENTETEEPKEKTRLEKYQEQKEERIRPKRIGE